MSTPHRPAEVAHAPSPTAPAAPQPAGPRHRGGRPVVVDAGVGGVWDAGTGGRIRQIRLARGWSQRRLIHAMRLAARQQRRELPADESMISMLSRWENGRRVPDEYNRHLLCEALGVNVGELSAVEAEPLTASLVLNRLAAVVPRPVVGSTARR